MADLINPLNEAHYQQIQDGLEAARVGLIQAEMAQRAGLDVSADLARINASRDQLLKLKQVYFPNR
jgi:hypothetical protein